MSETNRAVSGRSKSELAYSALLAQILDGSYGPGDRLVLDQLAKAMSVSPVPVREALRRLEAEGYVVFQHNVGAQVAAIDPEQYVNTMQVLAVLEGAATAAAVPLLTADDLDGARELNETMRRNLAGEFNPIAFTATNHAFHATLCGRCPNPHLRALVEREWSRLDLIRRSSFSIVPDRARASVAEHEALLRLIESGAPGPDIEQAARDHKLGTARALLAQRRGTATTKASDA